MSSLSQLDMLNRPLEEQLLRPEIDESSLSSKSSCTTHSSFQDLKSAWEHTIVTNSPPTKSFNNSTTTKPSKLRTNLQQFAEQQSNLVTKVNNARSGRVAVGEGMRKGGEGRKRRYIPGTKSRSIISNDSYKSNLYTHTERSGESDSPYETTTASTTASGSHYPRTHGRRRDLARKKSRGEKEGKKKKKGDLAREFDETSGGILSKHLNHNRNQQIPESPIQSNESTNSSVATSDIGSIATASDDEQQSSEDEEQTPPVPPDLNVIPSALNEGKSSLDLIPSALNEGEPSSRDIILGSDTQQVGNNNTSLSTGLTEKLQVCNTIHGEFTSLQNEVMSLLLSDHSTVQSLNISSSKQNQLKCDICQSTSHPTLRCKVLTDDSNTNHVSIEMIHILNKLKNKLDVEQRENALYISNSNANTTSTNLPPRAAPLIIKKGSDISTPNERQPTDGAVCQGSSEIIVEQQQQPQPSSNNAQQQPTQEIKLDKFGNEINPEKDKVALNAFLTNPSGMNWEDLVRSMKKKTGLEALVGQELIIDLNDDNVSDLDADPQEDEGSYKYTGDLSCMGNILSNYMRRKKSEGNDDGDSTLCDPLCDDTSISSKEEEESEVRSWGGKESSEDEVEDDPGNDLVEKVIACQLSPEEEVSPLRSPRQQDTLEKNIERVVLGQDQEELKHMYEQEKIDKVTPKSSAQEDAAAAAENKPIAPLSPPRSSSMTPRSRRIKARGAAVANKRPSITSGSSSAFSPIKSSPTTPTASLETTFDSSEFSDPFNSSASFSSPQRVRSKSTPPSKFRSIEPPPPDLTEQPFSPEPISPRPQRSPKRGRSVDSRAHNVNVAPKIPSSPLVKSRVDPSSEPPILIMSMSAEEESSHVDMDQSLLLSTDEMDISAMKQESLLDELPKITPSVDVDEETFHQQIRGATPSLLNDKDVAVAASATNDKKEEDTPSTVAPFPTSFDASKQNSNRNLNKKNSSSKNGKAVLLGWVDDNGNLVYGDQEKEATSNRLKDSNDLDAKQILSTSLRSGTDHEEEVDDSVDGGRRTPRLFILPQSLSINREKKVSCWEMAFHRIRRTKGEF